MARTRYRLPEELQGTILERIVAAKLPEVEGAREKYPAVAIRQVLERAPAIRSLENALGRRPPGVIAEIKRASPSAGLFRGDFQPAHIAAEYEAGGAAAISVVTEVSHFRGGLEILASLRWMAGLPLLRKDFIVDPYQVLEARHAGADAVLLITALLDTSSLKSLREEVEGLGMEALVEVHDERELERALEAGARCIGVNNRDLRTFEVSLDVSRRMAKHIPQGIIAVAESGIRTRDEIEELRSAGYRGFLVGEGLLRAESPGAALAALVSGHGKRRAS